MQLGAAGLGWTFLPGCQSLDRIFLGEYREDAERVTIIGSGLAGLVAAYELKKRQIPFQVFEGSGRVGGRIHTIPDFLAGQPVAELGAEWFTSSQKRVFDLAKELRLDLYESKDLRERFRRGDKIVNLSEISAELTRAQRAIRKDQTVEQLNSISLDDWIKNLTLNPVVRQLVLDWSLQRYGVSAAKLSANCFAAELRSNALPLAPWTEQRFRMRSGASSLTDTLFERVCGFEPERTFSFNHVLKSVRQLKRGYELGFETPRGSLSVSARAVICTIPVSGLGAIDGIREFPGPWDRAEEFVVGNHAKTIFSYSQRFWASSPTDMSRIHSFSPGQDIWEASFKQNPLFQFRQGVLTSQVGGEAAKQVGPQFSENLKAELGKIFKPSAQVQELDQASVNWGSHPLFQGSIPVPYVDRRPNLWRSPVRSWQWAGDYVSDKWRGTLNGAIESATASVEAIAKSRTIR